MKNALLGSYLEASDQPVPGTNLSLEMVRLDGISAIKSDDGSILALILRDESCKDEVDMLDMPERGRFLFVLNSQMTFKYAWG